MNYVLLYSDPAEADLERLNVFHNRRDPDYMAKWEADLSRALQELSGFPGPLSHARDEEASAYYGREVRRMLYYGPTKRRTGTPVRILFTVLPPDPAEAPETADAAIFLLRLLHSAQALIPDDAS